MLVPVSVVNNRIEERDRNNRSGDRKRKRRREKDEPHPHEEHRGDVIDVKA